MTTKTKGKTMTDDKTKPDERLRDLTNLTDQQLDNAIKRVAGEEGKWEDEAARKDFASKLDAEKLRREPTPKDA